MIDTTHIVYIHPKISLIYKFITYLVQFIFVVFYNLYLLKKNEILKNEFDLHPVSNALNVTQTQYMFKKIKNKNTTLMSYTLI